MIEMTDCLLWQNMRVPEKYPEDGGQKPRLPEVWMMIRKTRSQMTRDHHAFVAPHSNNPPTIEV